MISDKRLSDAIKAIHKISNSRRVKFEKKLQQIIVEITQCMQSKSGSIMLLKGRKSFEIVASTKSTLIGLKQQLEENTPSFWVVENRSTLNVRNIDQMNGFQKRFDHYKGDAFLLAPIIRNEKVMGIVSITNRVGGKSFTIDEEDLLLNITSQVISALENQRLLKSLRRKERTLQKKNLELKKLEELKTDLFNMLIHDLKGPISELIANLDILSYKLTDENLEYVDSAKNGCNTLYSMVSNLLDIVRLEEGRIRLIHESIDPHDLVKESLARLFGLVKLKNIHFVHAFPSPDPLIHFWADRGILLRVLQNLLTNAINYSPMGGTIEVGYHLLDSKEVEFFVCDDGPGVAEEFRETIFDKYFQLEKKSDGRTYTTGLGLTFCKMAIEAHGGKISVLDKNKKGSKFLFVLPLEMKR